MNTEAFQSAVQTIAAVPQLANAYNLGPMFSYLFKSQRADVAQFEKSPEVIRYEQAQAQWQQAVQMLTETLLKNPDMTPEQIQQSLPPQPTPDQFGIDPYKPTKKTKLKAKKISEAYRDWETDRKSVV